VSTPGRGARVHDDGRPRWPAPLRVFRDGDSPPPADVVGLIDCRGTYFTRVMNYDYWSCQGGDPLTWHEMSCTGPFVEAPRLPDVVEVAAAIAADEARRSRTL
jgi:hypothetical protein